MFQLSNDYLMITVTVIVILVSTFKYCMWGKNNTTAFNHSGIITKLITDTTECSEILTAFMHTNPSVIGLDCEWAQNNKISLLQIANKNMI